TSCASNLKQIMTAYKMYEQENEFCPYGNYRVGLIANGQPYWRVHELLVPERPEQGEDDRRPHLRQLLLERRAALQPRRGLVRRRPLPQFAGPGKELADRRHHRLLRHRRRHDRRRLVTLPGARRHDATGDLCSALGPAQRWPELRLPGRPREAPREGEAGDG